MHSGINKLLDSSLHKLDQNGCPVVHNLWQKLLSNTASKLLPAWHQSPWMEWEYGTWVGTFAAYDEIGRQLGEANVLPAWQAKPLADRWRPFKGAGIRKGRPYNMDAMHEIVHCWDALLVDAASLREIYCHRYKDSGKHRHLSALDLYVIATVAVSISSFLLRRGDNPTPDGALPRHAAAAFKVLGGMFAATNRMMGQANPMLLQDELDGEVFLQYLEDENLLLSPEMRACGGPMKMIRQILEILIEPAETAPTNGLAYLGEDIERAFDYGVECARIDTGVLLYWRMLGEFLRPRLQQADIPDALRQTLLKEPELGLEDNTPLKDYQQVAQNLFDRLGDSQAELDFLQTLPLLEDDVLSLETAMRTLFRHQQEKLDQILQRTSPPVPADTWTPAPCSGLLQDVQKYIPLAQKTESP